MIKTAAEIELMAESGRLLASVFAHIDTLALAGMSTLEINDRVEAYIVDDLKARPASKGQYGYGFVLNCSINAVVCHGVPSADEILKDGDIVNLDITLEKDGFIADSSKTYMIGNVHAPARRLVRATYEAMWKGIRAVKPGAT
ncbi:MAG: M24 family metallopeptidase, partial [Brevundimonas sp.]